MSGAKIDWAAAYAFWAGQGPARTFASVAERFGISDTAVRLHARKHGWERRVAAVDTKVRLKTDERIVSDRSARVAKTLELVEEVRTQLLERVRNGDADLRLADFPALARLEALLEGEATDRVSIPELQDFMLRLVQVSTSFVPRERREAFLEAIEGVAATIPGSVAAAELPQASEESA